MEPIINIFIHNLTLKHNIPCTEFCKENRRKWKGREGDKAIRKIHVLVMTVLIQQR
jgi:hypothetical protein